jgi:hypothetical protein
MKIDIIEVIDKSVKVSDNMESSISFLVILIRYMILGIDKHKK